MWVWALSIYGDGADWYERERGQRALMRRERSRKKHAHTHGLAALAEKKKTYYYFTEKIRTQRLSLLQVNYRNCTICMVPFSITSFANPCKHKIHEETKSVQRQTREKAKDKAQHSQSFWKCLSKEWVSERRLEKDWGENETDAGKCS